MERRRSGSLVVNPHPDYECSRMDIRLDREGRISTYANDRIERMDVVGWFDPISIFEPSGGVRNTNIFQAWGIEMERWIGTNDPERCEFLDMMDGLYPREDPMDLPKKLKMNCFRSYNGRRKEVYHLLSFVNHSCISNCVVFIRNERAFLVAMIDIERGEEITINYIFSDDPVAIATVCEVEYEFRCNCDFCSGNFPYTPNEWFDLCMVRPCFHCGTIAFLSLSCECCNKVRYCCEGCKEWDRLPHPVEAKKIRNKRYLK